MISGISHQISSDSPSDLTSLPACQCSRLPLSPRRGLHNDGPRLSAERECVRERPPPTVPGVSVTAGSGAIMTPVAREIA